MRPRPTTRRPVVVIAGQVPPPVGGQNVAIQHLLQELRADERWTTEHLALDFNTSFATLGTPSLSKAAELARVLRRAARLRQKHGRLDLLLYPTGGPNRAAILRDLALLPLLSLLVERVWVHFHAGGIADRLDASVRPLRRALQLAHRGVEGAIIMCRANATDPEALGIRRVEVIPLRIPDENPAAALPDPTAPPAILHAGHLHGPKGTPTLIEAFAGVLREHPSARLTLMGEFLPPYGEAECRARLAALGIEDRVEITGLLRGEAKAAVFRRSNVFAFSSVASESFGLVVVEAMMWGLTVVSTNWRGNREVGGDAALYADVRPDPVGHLAAALSRACEPSVRALHGPAGRQRFEERYRDGPAVFSAFVGDLLRL